MLKEMINCMLLSSGVPDNIWIKAILLACHLQNKISYKKTNKMLEKLEFYVTFKRNIL